jgi:hypothetical protein
MREGDICKWKWKPELGRNNWGEFGDYHCKSQVAIVHEGIPLDTYWMNFGSSFKQEGWADSRSGAHSVCTNSADFELIANLQDLEEIRHGDEIYYRRSEIVDLRHTNSSSAPVYKRAGATKSLDVMRELLDKKIQGCDDQIRSAEHAKQRYLEQREKLVSGDTEILIY